MLLALALLAQTSVAAVDAAPPPSRFVAPPTRWSGRSASLVRAELAEVKAELENNQPQSVLGVLLGTLLGGGGTAALGGVIFATASCGGGFVGAACGLFTFGLGVSLVAVGALIAIIGAIAGIAIAASNSSRSAERERLQARRAELQAELDVVDPPWPEPPPPPREPMRLEPAGVGAAPAALLTLPL